MIMINSGNPGIGLLLKMQKPDTIAEIFFSVDIVRKKILQG